MTRHPLLRWILSFQVLFFANVAGALEYPNNKELAQQLKRISSGHGKIVQLESLARTPGKNELWRVEIGKGDSEQRKKQPALLLVAGIEGNDLAGTVSAIAWLEMLAESFAKDKKIQELLETTTIYIFPRLNPDATERFFTKPKWETPVSRQPVDDDHDGLVDEDGPDDLDGDGLITSMRVEDPEGEYILDPSDSRLLIKADRTKGEKGAWRLLSEGIDNDHDNAWNEDGPGGINFNRNFPYNYKFFAPWAGLHQISEVETRALADFMVAHPNIGIIFTFGAADNLVQTPKSEAGGKRPPAAISDEDIPYYRELGKAWREGLGLKKELQASSEPGTFSDWMYFHRGRLSLAARPWSPAIALELAKAKAKEAEEKAKEDKKETPKGDKGTKGTEAKKEEKPDADKTTSTNKPPAGKKEDNRNEEERAFLKWVDENAPELFVNWKAFDHPDFPGKKVEIGGFAPFAKTNPPKKFLEDLAQTQAKFLTELAGKFPRIGIRKTETKPLGESVYDVTIQVENTGYLPTSLAQGSLTREVNPTRVIFKVADKDILSGSRINMLGPIEGSGGMKEVRLVLLAKGLNKIEVEVISILGGSSRLSIDLKEGK